MPRMPFWHGEAPHRDYYMGLQVGAFRRAVGRTRRAAPIGAGGPRGRLPAEARRCWTG